MLATPYSRRLRIAGTVTLFALITAYIHSRPRWTDSSMGMALETYQSVSTYLSGSVINNTLYSEGNQDVVHPYFNVTDGCNGFPDTSNILLVMKTGATEAFDKLPTHLLTTMRCLKDFLIFSDMVG